MGNDPKYVIFDSPSVAGPLAIVFPNFMDHSKLVRMVRGDYPGYNVISAGFVDLRGEKVVAYGRSTGLNVTSMEGDDRIIARQIRGEE